MRKGITIGYEHGSQRAVLVKSPSIPLRKQMEDIKDAAGEQVHPKFELLEIWESDCGIRKRQKFISPKQAQELADARAKAVAAAKAAEAAAAKEKSDAEAERAKAPDTTQTESK